MRLVSFLLAIALGSVASVPALAQQTSSGPVPTCASGDPVVWVNTNTKKYHMQGDAYYGKTKQGKYLCKSAADAAGDKAAKMTSKASGAAPGTNMNTGTTRTPMPSGAAPGTNMNPESAPSPAPSATMSHKHHHTSSGATSGTNMNTDESAPSPVPSATMGHKHRHHKKMSASPSPDVTPSPSAT